MPRFKRYTKEQKALYERILARFVYKDDFSEKEQEKAFTGLTKLIEMYGAPVTSYPAWHPLMKATTAKNETGLIPLQSDPTTNTDSTMAYYAGYVGTPKCLDHTFYLQNAIISCPYGNDEDEAYEKLEKLQSMIHDSYVRAYEAGDFKLYSSNTTTVVIGLDFYELNWSEDRSIYGHHSADILNYELENKYCSGLLSDILDNSFYIPKEHAVPLMLKNELCCYGYAERTEKWSSMKDYILGVPENAFVCSETYKALKDAWNVFEKHEIYGKLKQ